MIWRKNCMGNNDVDVSSKFNIELNSKHLIHSKQGSSEGNNTKEAILKEIQKQKEKNKK